MPMLLIVHLEALSLIYIISLMSQVEQSTPPDFLDQVMSGTGLIFGVGIKVYATPIGGLLDSPCSNSL